MISRYDYMKESQVRDTDGDTFPDPLSISFNDIQFTKVPEATQITAPDLDKFWMFMYKNYGRPELDDILLNINGVPYIGMLNPGDVFFKVDQGDMLHFDNQKLLNSIGG